MKVWSQAEEAERLKTRFVGVNRAEFARTHKVPGGAAMVYQHIQAMRPINLEQAIAYAKGFKVPLGEISPRLAKIALEALGHASQPGVSSVAETAQKYAVEDKFAMLHRLPETCQAAILTLADAMLASPAGKAVKRKEPAHAT